jgi:4-amino-4-deoxy-L-arabinose transferase-like glycosyltransferase
MGKRFLLVTGLILLLTLGLRLTNLNSLPVFADESIYVRWAQVMRAEPSLRFLPLSDGKQPLYMWALMPVLKIISDPLIAGRGLSAIIGMGTVIGMGLLSWVLFQNRGLALISALLWAVIPFAVFFNRLALVDGLLTCFIVWGTALAVLAFQRLRWDFAMLAGFAFGFAWLTKSPAVFALVLLPSLLIFSWPHHREKYFISRILLLTSTIYILAFGMYQILRLGPEFHLIAIRNRDYIRPLSQVLANPLDPLVPHLRDGIKFFWYFLTPAGIILAVWGLVSCRKKYLRERLILSFWWLVPVMVQAFIAQVFTARYLLYTAPFAVLLASLGIMNFGKNFKWALGLVVVPSVLFDCLLFTTPQSLPLPRIERAGYLEEWTAGFGIRQVSDYIKKIPGPVIVGSEGFFGTPFSALQMYLNNYPDVRIVGVGSYIDSVSDKLTNARADNQVYLVVNSSRFYADPEHIGLELISSYSKAAAPDGTREELLFFKVK